MVEWAPVTVASAPATPATLDERALKALAAVRAQVEGKGGLRFAVERHCGANRARLSVYYRGAGYTGAPGSQEFRLGLAYSEDAEALEDLRRSLEAEERIREGRERAG